MENRMKNEELKQIFHAVAITRVSTIRQDVFGESPEEQIDLVEIARQRASAQFQCEIKNVKTFPFAESASVAYNSQPVQKVLTYIKDYNHHSKTPIRFVFIKCIDRFTRAGGAVYGQLQTEFAKEGVTLLDAYGVISPTKVNTLEHLGVEYKWSVFRPSHITEMLEAERAQEEVRVNQTRMIGAAIRYVRLGYWRGTTPLGFIAVKKDTEHGKRLVLNPHPEEAKWFVRMFRLKAEGVKTDQEIVDEVNKMGFITRPKKYRDKENRSKIIAIKGKRKLNVKMLRNYIQNPIFAGVNTERWLIQDGELKPVYLKEGGLVSVELFNKANHGKVMIVDDKGQPMVYRGEIPEWQHKKLKLNPNFPWKQYVLCPICSHQLKGSAPRGKLKPVPTYHCALNHKYWGINAKKLEDAIVDFVKNVKFSQKFIYNFEVKFMSQWKAKLDQLNQDNINWEKRLAELRTQLQFTKDQLDIASTQEGIHHFEEKITRIKADIAQATIERNQKEDEEVDIQTILNAAKYWMEHFHFLLLETRNPLHRAALFGKIFEELPTYEILKNGTPKLSSLFALNQTFNTGQNLLSGIDETRTRNLFRDREAL